MARVGCNYWTHLHVAPVNSSDQFCNMGVLQMDRKFMNGCVAQRRIKKNNENYFVDSFEDTNLRNELLRRIGTEGLEKPTPLQQNVITPWLRGHDCIIHARRQTGKKTALAIAVLQAIDADIQHCQVLIIVPHKERAFSIVKKLNDLCDFENFQWHIATSSDSQADIAEVGTGVHVVIVTISCACDLVHRNLLKTDFVKMVVLDDTIHVLSERHNAQTWEVLKALKSDAQIILMSTVSSLDPSQKSRRHLESVNLKGKKGKATEAGVKQICRPAIVDDKKYEVLLNVHREVKSDVSQLVIFFEKILSTVHTGENVQNSTVSCSNSQTKDSNSGIQDETSQETKLVDNLDIFKEELSSEKVSDNLLGTVPGEILNKDSACFAERDRIGMQFERAGKHMLKDRLHLPVDIYNRETESSFGSLNLDKELLHGIYVHNLRKPTPLQEKAIIHCIQGSDAVVQGLPRTGKKTAVSLTALQSISPNLLCCQVLILTSERYTAQHLVEMLNHLACNMSIQCCCCIGGSDIKDLCTHLKSAQIVVGTAGYIYKMILRKTLVTDHIKLLIHENACHMVSPQLDDMAHSVIGRLNSGVQKMFFANFITLQQLNKLDTFLKSPIYIIPRNKAFTTRSIRQFYVEVGEEMKFETLCSLYDAVKITKAVIFCNTKNDVNWLAEDMQKKGFNASAVHSDIICSESDKILNRFSLDDNHTLVTTDLIGSGSIPYVAVVINFQLPLRNESYIRRISRHPEGIFLSIITKHEEKWLKKMSHFFSAGMTKLETFDSLSTEFNVGKYVNQEITTSENSGSLDFILEKHFYNCLSAVERSFCEISFQEQLLEGIQQSGFEKPTPLQHSSIIPFMEGHDIVIHAHPGTGKKTFVAIAALQSIDYNSDDCQVLILSNDKENSVKIQQVINQLCPDAKVYFHSGRQRIKKKTVKEKQAHIFLGTPYYLSTLMHANGIQISKVKFVAIVDSADTILSPASNDDISHIFSALNFSVQVIFLSSSVKRQTLEDFKMLLGEPFHLVACQQRRDMKN